MFSAYYRIYNQKNPSLSCSQQEDKFTVSIENGNGKLTYPVGLITIDEVALAGGVYLLANPEFYLYTGQTYWTMSPYYFGSSNANANIWGVHSSGYLGGHWVTSSYSVRPVINLKNGIKIISGDGSTQSPYVIG